MEFKETKGDKQNKLSFDRLIFNPYESIDKNDNFKLWDSIAMSSRNELKSINKLENNRDTFLNGNLKNNFPIRNNITIENEFLN